MEASHFLEFQGFVIVVSGNNVANFIVPLMTGAEGSFSKH